jgi:hypothetical protein
MALLNGGRVPLAGDIESPFATESAARRMEPPTDGGAPVRVETGGTVVDDAGTGAAATFAAFTLKTDTVVSIDVLAMEPSVTGFTPVSQVVQYASNPPGAVAFSPGIDLVFPLRPEFRGTFPPGARLRLFQLAASGVAFQDTGIEAEVIESSDFAITVGVEVFGTYTLFLPRGQQIQPSVVRGPWSLVRGEEQMTTDNGQRTNDNRRLYFPVIDQRLGHQTRLSLANPDRSQARTVTLTAFDDEGTVQGIQSVVTPAGQPLSRLLSDVFPGLRSGAIVAQADGVVTGFYEIADNFTAPQMLDGAEAVVTPLSAMVFPLIRAAGGASTEIHLFNPNEGAVQVRLAAFRSDGSRVTLTRDMLILEPQQGMISSSARIASFSLPFPQLEGGCLFVESYGGSGIVGTEVVEEVVSGQRNLAILNGVGVPSGCAPSGAGECRGDASVPPASRQHSAHIIHLESDPIEAEVILANVSESDARVAFSAFDATSRFLGSQPRGVGAFLVLRPHQVIRQSVRSLFGFNPGQLGGYLRIEDPDSAVVGAVVNRDGAAGRFLTALPLVPDLAQQGQEVTDAFFSRLQIEAGAGVETGAFIVNPNNNAVRFKFTVIDATGAATESTQTVIGRGTFIRTRPSLRVLFPNASSGYFRIEVEADPRPGTSERLVPYATYRSANYLSAVPPQLRE